ncbi:MAG: amino acid adenylation domain-containing protein [Symploca sp. SIO2E6]|nr:amino acid adenylation domain-containing protein [Symploca sp. SIO2E6]
MSYLLHQLLETTAKSDPEKKAVVDENQSLTYRELDQSSHQLAQVLRSSGIKKSDRIGICLDRSIEVIVAIYGILKAGAVYVPIDPTAPVQRIAFFIENCGIKALVTTRQKISILYQEAANKVSKYLQCVLLKEDTKVGEAEDFDQTKVVTWKEILQWPNEPLSAINLIENDLAHILYTSGSTGEPKGVMLSHRASLSFANCFYEFLQIQPSDRIAHQIPIYFAPSIIDLFATIRAGATLVIIPSELLVFPTELANYLEEQQITILSTIPTVLKQLINHGNLQQHKFLDLRIVMFAGEVFPIKYMRQLKEMIPHSTYYNLYGSTETLARTCYRVEDIPPDMESIPLGQTCSNTELFVVNEHQEIVSPGEVGELYFRGPSLMKGYWGMPDKTQEVMVPYSKHPDLGEEIVFRTNDLVKQDKYGNYIFVGRRDHMIKSRGYRIELGDIETTLHSHPGIKEAVIIPIPDEQMGNRLNAIVVTKDESNLQASDLQYFCAERLPKYMVPDKIEFRSDLPRTSTGKIDRTLLRKKHLLEAVGAKHLGGNLST